MDAQLNDYSGEMENYTINLLEKSPEHSDESIDVFDCPAKYVPATELSSSRLNIFPHNAWS